MFCFLAYLWRNHILISRLLKYIIYLLYYNILEIVCENVIYTEKMIFITISHETKITKKTILSGLIVIWERQLWQRVGGHTEQSLESQNSNILNDWYLQQWYLYINIRDLYILFLSSAYLICYIDRATICNMLIQYTLCTSVTRRAILTQGAKFLSITRNNILLPRIIIKTRHIAQKYNIIICGL